jgi:hypothetical protein
MRCQVVILMVTCFLCQEILRLVLFFWSLDETKRIGRISLLLIYFIPFRRKTKKKIALCVWEMFLGVRFFSHSLISIYLCKFSYSFILEHLITPIWVFISYSGSAFKKRVGSLFSHLFQVTSNLQDLFSI